MQELDQVELVENQVKQLQEALRTNKQTQIDTLIESMHAIDIAIGLEDFEDDELLSLYAILSDKQIAEILEQAEEKMQVRMLQLMDNYRIIYLFSYMSKDDIVDILGNLSINKRKNILNLMKNGEMKAVQELLGYEEDTAGGIMTTEYIALNSNLSIGDALNKIREIGPRTEVIETIFVLNANRQLIGTADLRDILTEPKGEKLSSITNENSIFVQPETDQEEVARLVSKYDLKAIPVVNKRNALLGIITVDDIIDVIVEETTEDILQLGGVSKEENIDSSIAESVKRRLPWLFVNLITAFIASFTVSAFEGVIAQVVALAAAMPIVAGMGGNAGSQTLSIVIRSIALGEVTLKDSWKLVFKQVLLGIIHGAATGIITGIILFVRYGNPYLGFIIFAAMVGNMVIAGIFGFLTPLILKAIGIDPALASAIFLTTATDVFGFLLFLGLAQIFLPFLL